MYYTGFWEVATRKEAERRAEKKAFQEQMKTARSSEVLDELAGAGQPKGGERDSKASSQSPPAMA